MKMVTKTDKFSEAIATIVMVDRPYCFERWREVFGRQPPKHLSLRFMKRVLIWEVQCRMLGGVPAKTDHALERITKGRPPPAI